MNGQEKEEKSKTGHFVHTLMSQVFLKLLWNRIVKIVVLSLSSTRVLLNTIILIPVLLLLIVDCNYACFPRHTYLLLNFTACQQSLDSKASYFDNCCARKLK